MQSLSRLDISDTNSLSQAPCTTVQPCHLRPANTANTNVAKRIVFLPLGLAYEERVDCESTDKQEVCLSKVYVM